MWAVEHDFLILGTRFRVQATRPEYGEELARLLQPFDYGRRTGVRGRHTFSIVDGELVETREPGMVVAYRDCQRIATGIGPHDAIASMLATINRMAVDDCPDLAIHAGVVALGGTGIAFPAESGGGKTTLTGACLQNGFSYASDEALVIGADNGAVVRYPKPLALTSWSRDRLGVNGHQGPFTPGESGESFLTASDLGARLAQPETRLGHIVLAEFGHDKASLSEAPAGEAMAKLLQLSFNHYKDGERAFRLAAQLANQARTWRLRYGDPIAAALLVKQQLAGAAASASHG